MSRAIAMIVCLVAALIFFPPQWYPQPLRLQLAVWFGAGGYQEPLPSESKKAFDFEPACPADISGWREAWQIEGVDIRRSATCVVDNPYAVSAFVRGTNNVPKKVLMKSGLTSDAVEKGRDLDGDGDPDEIHIRLEVAELNGGSPESSQAVTRFSIAPGVNPGLWVFAPKMVGMARENFDSPLARPMLRLPSPAIRIEQGDRVKVTLENSHYMPHTLHFHGVDHPFLDAEGEGNDGVPITSELPLLPGAARTYDLQPRHAGTMFYHCHVQPHVHIMMGLQGLFIVEENRPNNWLQTLNVGAGHVRSPSVAVREKYDREYDLHYMDIDADLNNRLRSSNDPRIITRSLHRDYDVTQASSDYFTLNGRSFPYTFRESLVIAKPDENIKLRVVNGGSTGLALHTHGHKATITHRDGVASPVGAQITRDVVWMASAQRLDLDLHTGNDGLHSYGPGVWLLHDHQGKAVTNKGIGPGGNVSAIVYEQYLQEDGWPKTFGVKWDKYFSESYYRKKIPVWESYIDGGVFSDVGVEKLLLFRLLGFSVALGVFFSLFFRQVVRE